MIRFMGILVLVAGILLTVACAGTFTPAECEAKPQALAVDIIYRDLIRGEGAGECYGMYGTVLEPVGDDGYRIDIDGVGDIFFVWQGEEIFVEGDFIEFAGVAIEPLTYETVLGGERTIPALHGASIELMY